MAPDDAAIRQFLRRYRKAAILAGVFFLLLLGFAVDRELQQRRITREHERARQVSEFWSELFDLEAEDIDKPRSQLTARDLLDRGAARIEELRGQPRLQADLMTVIGRSYLSLGLCEAAAPLLERALSLRRKIHGNVHPEVAESLDLLAGLEVSRGHYRRAESLARESFEIPLQR